MDRYPRFFVMASLVYLAIGAGMGALMAMGVLDRFAWRFVHFHLNLLGFMTMIVSGVAYHVIPRFTGRPVSRPRLVAAHFWLANTGLLGMTMTRGLEAARADGVASRIFPFFAVIAAVGAWLFVWNLFPLLASGPARVVRGRVDSRMKVSEVLARWPSSLEVFRHWGFNALANPAARATFARLVTIEKACAIHKVDLAGFLLALNAVADKGGIPLPLAPDAGGGPAAPPSERASGAAVRRVVRADTCVGDLIREQPATRAVLERFFGPDCFSCPGQLQETVAQSASMHGVDTEELLGAIEQVLGPAPEGGKQGSAG